MRLYILGDVLEDCSIDDIDIYKTEYIQDILDNLSTVADDLRSVLRQRDDEEDESC